MPELPEVETVARQLAPMITGRKIRWLTILDHKLDLDLPRGFAGREIADVSRLGKQVVIVLDRSLWISIHLRMTGRLIWYPEGRAPCETRHVRFRLSLTGGEVWFHDTRRFGTLSVSSSLEPLMPRGMEPLSARFTARCLSGLLGRSDQALKVWLLRQDRLVGLGNIYACEILFAAGLSPLRAAGSLDRGETARLHRAIRRILRRAIDCCGTTFSDFQDARGVYGGFQEFLAVYAREGERCRRCRATVLRISQQQRSTFFCPECQR